MLIDMSSIFTSIVSIGAVDALRAKYLFEKNRKSFTIIYSKTDKLYIPYLTIRQDKDEKNCI
jgi:hypothetical protein